MKKVTKGDIEGGESKIWHFCGVAFFEWPLDLIRKCNYDIIIFESKITMSTQASML